MVAATHVGWERTRSPVLSGGGSVAVHIARVRDRTGHREAMTGAADPVPPDGTPSVPPEGTTVRVRGERGTWTARGTGRDGSVTLAGGPARQWRSVMPDRIVVMKGRRRRGGPAAARSGA